MILLKNKIYYKKYNITIESINSFNYIEKDSIILDDYFFYFQCNFTNLGKINRFYVFRKEILNNLPKVKINFDDLYIYIRGGDIFSFINKTSLYYVQPPLCFYNIILNQFTFRKVIIISEDKSNPVIPKLLKEYPYIKLNQNLKFLWEYDFYMLSDRFLHLHHSVCTFSFNYNIYKMNVSENYKNLMFPFHNSEKQRKIMIEEKCDNKFDLIHPRFSLFN